MLVLRIKDAQDTAKWGRRETGIETSISLCLGRALLEMGRVQWGISRAVSGTT